MPNALDIPAVATVHVWRVELPAAEGRAAARRSLDTILADYLGGPESAALVDDPGGKPRLASRPERLSFNLAHSAGLALVAIAAGETAVGVDVERVKPRRDLARLAGRWLSAVDAAAVAAAADGAEREGIFYDAWTRHEARVKCTGAGLFGAPPGPDVAAWPVEIDAGYAAAVALEPGPPDGAEPRITVRSWDR